MFLLDGRLEIIVTRQGPRKVRRARGSVLAGKVTGPFVSNHVRRKAKRNPYRNSFHWCCNALAVTHDRPPRGKDPRRGKRLTVLEALSDSRLQELGSCIDVRRAPRRGASLVRAD